MDDIDKVLKEMEITNSITDMIIEDNRRRHVTVLVSERGTWAEDRNQNNEGYKKTISNGHTIPCSLQFELPIFGYLSLFSDILGKILYS